MDKSASVGDNAPPRRSTESLDCLVRVPAIFTFATAGIALSGWALLVPSYTDQQIRASMVDTWEVEASLASCTIVVLLLTLCVSAYISVGTSRKSVRSLAACAGILSIVGIGCAYASHVALTVRATELTGQSFGALYGLI